MQESRLVRVVFAALVVITIGTFVAAQRLKTEVPLVLRFAANPRHISPNDDRVRDSTRIGFDLHDAATISFGIVNSDGDQVRSLFRDRRLPADSHNRFTWDGRDDAGKVVPDGTYRMRVSRKDRGRTLDSIKKVIVDTKPPKVSIASVTPDVFVPGRTKRVRIRYRGPINAAPEFRIWHTDVDGPPRIARRFRSVDGFTGTWDGRVGGGPTPDGSYAVTVLVRDKAGNLTEAPAGRRLPTARAARPGRGIVVERLSLSGPSTPVAAGSVARLRVGPVARPVRYALYRLGSAAAVREGERRAGTLRIGVPANARTGVYVVRVRAGGRRAEYPIAVRGRSDPTAAGRPLVVLPVATWQGLNRYDSDRDGFPDTLSAGDTVPVDRPYALGRPPAGLRRETAPLLEFLDRARLRYDVTTDVAIARGEGPKLADAPGVAVAGTEIWVPRQLRDGLRDQVEQRGLRVVSFGRESLRRTVAVVGDDLRDPSPARPDDLFGERTRVQRIGEPAPLVSERDRLRLFAGVDRVFGDFSLLERSEGVPTGGQLLTAAGRQPGGPAFVGYRLGKGLVIRPGTPQWTAQLSDDTLGLEVPRITRAIWRQLARPR